MSWGAKIGSAVGSLIGFSGVGRAIGQVVDNILLSINKEIKEALEKINEDPDYTKLIERANKIIGNYGYEVSAVSVKGKTELIFTVHIKKLKNIEN